MRTIVLAAVLTGVLSGAAAAQPLTRQWAWCRDDDPDRLIQGCSAIIGSRRETPGNLARAFFNRGRAWSDKGQQDRAIQDLNNAIRLEPNYPEAYNSLGVAHAGKGEYDQAVTSYDQAIRLDPNYAIALYNRALALQALGHKPEADRDFSQAKQVGPRMTPAKE